MKLAALLLLGSLALAPDLDVGSPPGSPMDWARQWRRPVPTGHARGIASVAARRTGGPGSTVVEERARPVDPGITISDVSGYFVGTSRDLPGHLSVRMPAAGGRDVATASDLEAAWIYPPPVPPELAWIAMTANLREILHPESQSWLENAAYGLDLGDPVLAGEFGGVGSQRSEKYLRKSVAALPGARPLVPTSKDPHAAMLHRLATIELSSGHPHALDPNYARRLSALGPESFDSLAACARSSHSFLARNATFQLGSCPHPDATRVLADLLRSTKDPVIWMRALMGLAARRERSVVPDLVKVLATNDGPRQAAATYALGMIGDPAGAEPVLALMKKSLAGDVDYLWSAIPALGRMKAGRAALEELRVRLATPLPGEEAGRAPGADPRTGLGNLDAPGTRRRTLQALCSIAIAMAGDDAARRRFETMFEDGGWSEFPPAVQLLLPEALGTSESGAELLAEMAVTSPKTSTSVRLKSLEVLARNERLPAAPVLELLANEAEDGALRAGALRLLGRARPVEGGPAARSLLEKIAKGGKIPAALATAAVEVAGREHPELLRAVLARAVEDKAVARREVVGGPQAFPPEVRAHAPLVETVLLEMGRAASPDLLPDLKRFLAEWKDPRGRAEAAAAIAACPGHEAGRTLLGLLEDADGWVRYVAYLGLRRRTGTDAFADWIFGSASARAEAVATWTARLDAAGTR